MATLQIESAAPPYDLPGLGVRAARLLGLAEAMGLLPGGQPIFRLDHAAVMEPIRQLLPLGIGRDAVLELETSKSPKRISELLDRLYQELLASPNPSSEVPALMNILGPELLTRLSGLSMSSLRRYAAGDRVPTDDVAARLHHLAVATSYLAGGYNDFGIRRWFVRRRAQLAGRAPVDVLSDAWIPEEEGPQEVLRLAEALNSSPAT